MLPILQLSSNGLGGIGFSSCWRQTIHLGVNCIYSEIQREIIKLGKWSRSESNEIKTGVNVSEDVAGYRLDLVVEVAGWGATSEVGHVEVRFLTSDGTPDPSRTYRKAGER